MRDFMTKQHPPFQWTDIVYVMVVSFSVTNLFILSAMLQNYLNIKKKGVFFSQEEMEEATNQEEMEEDDELTPKELLDRGFAFGC